MTLGDRDPVNRGATLAALDALLRKHEIDVAAIGKIKSVRIGAHDGFIKNADGEVERVESLGNSSIVFSPAWEDGPEWPVVAPAAPVRVPRRPVAAERDPAGTQVAVLVPDPQIGFYDVDGELIPFHDEAAMAIAGAIVRAVKPDRVVHLGDLLDFPAFSKYEQHPSWQRTTQAAIDRAHAFLVETFATDLVEGNHDARLAKAIRNNAAAAFGLRPANAPDSWPVLSVPYLLRLDELGVSYSPGYPAGRLWLSDAVAVDHGFNLDARKTLAEEEVSVFHGHTHHVAELWRTRRTRTGSRDIVVASPGCLCRVDGAVPGVRTGVDTHGRPVKAHQDWQQGVGVVTYDDSGVLAYEVARIREGVAWFRGRRYAS